jgi:hypothetical protein
MRQVIKQTIGFIQTRLVTAEGPHAVTSIFQDLSPTPAMFRNHPENERIDKHEQKASEQTCE